MSARGMIVALGVGAAAARPPAGGEAPPRVEIIATSGAVDGPADGAAGQPRWERVRLEVRIENRLPQDVGDLEVELSLRAATGRAGAIPGWTFKKTFQGPVVRAHSVADLTLERPLPPRRRSPPADEIAYRVRILGYRLRPPDLTTAIELLGSPHRTEQRAAHLSLDEAAARTLTAGERGAVHDEIALVLRTFVSEPSATDALRMLLAIRSVGSLGLTDLVPALLALPDRLDRAVWGRALIELATRMVGASEPGEPRLLVLPTWARASAVLTVRAEDAVSDAVRDAVLQMGDRAVPALLVMTRAGPTAAARARARRFLSALGRSTVRSQLQLRDTETKVQVVRAFGEIRARAAIVPLIDLLLDEDPVISVQSARALEDIGAPTVGPLMDALGRRHDERALAVLVRLGRGHPRLVRRQLWARGVAAGRRADLPARLARLRADRRRAQRAALEAAVDEALAVGAAGRFAEAVEALDRVFEREPAVYMAHASRIARLYRDRARFLYLRGNYDAAVRTARTGLSVHADEGSKDVLADAQLALVFGFIQLGDLTQAAEVLDRVAPDRRRAQQRRLRSELLAAQARRALERGEYSLARALVDQARAEGPDVAVEGLHRRLLVVENYAVLLVMGLLAPACLLALVLLLRQRWQKARLLALARQLDAGQGAAHSTK